MSGDENQSTGRTLGGSPVNDPLPSDWSRPANAGPRIGRVGNWGGSSSSSRSASGGRFATLRDIGSSSSGGPSIGGPGGVGLPPSGMFGPPSAAGGHAGHAHGSDGDDDDEEDNDREGENWFAGGERSGLSVQNPNAPGNQPGGHLVRDLLRQAAESGIAGVSNRPPHSSAFSGGGHRLGSDEVESTFVPDPNAAEMETAIRHLTLWRDGFSIEDGELYRYGDPRNEQILAEINGGRAPPAVVGVEVGQPVELRVVRRLQEEYIPHTSTNRAFTGAGHRLGSPVPGVGTATTTAGVTTGMPGSFPAGPHSGDASTTAERAVQRESFGTRFEVDQTKPTTSVQVRLADGTRMVCHMNLDHTVGDIRNFINASRPENITRPYTIGTTFPNRVLEDDKQTIKDAGLEKGVIVQRWV
ncbi:unnamed protein product [Somion occarium]|uniref:SEP-domain-containing protein n=1 Tax=Somion occarium TaxID=3059160 RepID=A0ABP1D436_9APHY